MIDGDPPPDRRINEERVETAKELAPHIDTAQFNLFQEYQIDVNRRDGTIGHPRKYITSRERDLYYEEEMVKYNRILASHGFSNGESPPFGNMYVQYGEEGGLYIVEGAGRILHDTGGREDYSSFTLRFDDMRSQRNLLDWLNVEGNEALRHLFDRVVNEYDENGTLVYNDIPPEYARQKGLRHPFESKFNNLLIQERPLSTQKRNLRGRLLGRKPPSQKS